MKEIETKSWLIISCLLISGIALFVQSDTSENLTSMTDENVARQMDPDDSDLWILGAQGQFNGSILGYTIFEGESVSFQSLPMDPTNRWYVMNNNAPATFSGSGSIDLTISYSGQNMVESNSYDVKSWLWSLDQNGTMHRHTNSKTLDIDLVTGQTSFSDNYSIMMIDIPDGASSQIVRPNGCYWVEYWVYDETQALGNSPGFILPGGKTEMVSFGLPCPTDDTDGDTWTDTQEIGFGSDKDDPTSTPWTEYLEYGDARYVDGCVAGGGQVDNTGTCTPSPWNDGDGDGNDDVSYGNGYDDGRDSVDCPWQTQQWDGSACVDIVDPTSDNQEHYDNGYAAACEEVGGTMTNGVCVIENDCPDCPEPTNTDDTDRDGVIDIFEDSECMNTPPDSYVDSDGCAYEIPIQPNGSETPCPCEDDDVNLTGSGDVADLTVIGGAGLLAGIGATTAIGQTGRGPRTSGGGNKKPDIDLDDVGDAFDNLDLDMDADLDMDRPKVDTAKPQSVGGSDQYFKSGVERQKAMTDSADTLLDDYTEDESED